MPRRAAPALQGSLFGSPEKRSPAKKKTPRSPQPVSLPPGKKRWLSATGLESLRRCPRCFWLQYNMKIRQPEGIVSRLANRYDILIKKYFDLYRGTPDLPPFIAGQVTGRLESPFQETYFYTINARYGYMGKLDECLVQADGRYTPVDHKTSSSDPRDRELIPAYQFQLDSYAFLLEQNRKPTTGIGHLIYYYPGDSEKLHAQFPMEVIIKTLSTDPSRVPPRLAEATAVLDGPIPSAAPECPFCQYIETVTGLV